MPFSWNFRSFGRFNSNPIVEKQFVPNGLAPPYNPPGRQNGIQSPSNQPLGPQQIRTATRPRRLVSVVGAFCLFITVIFLIMVEVGNTYNQPGLRDIWFIKLVFSDIQPIQNGTEGVGYGVAEYLHLYDYYQIGLWNYCGGWNATGLVNCTEPRADYWWNPFDMFNGVYGNQTGQIPPDLEGALGEIKACNQWTFGLFMAGACLSFVLIPTVMFGVKSKWISLALACVTFLNMICVVAAAIIASVVWVLIKELFQSYVEIIDIVPHIGATMFAMMWVAAAFSIFAFLLQVVLSCFFASERDIKTGRRQGKMYNYQ